ncbi:DUF6090 family protein [Hanstruepera marina]|uniref:DUF6090 family protein n=1 Tax=Hanstruepera marina TaxID=2873265 RepID=UPI001CA65E49|nr:DUF6090 family protein [Hanstruepera marina]
MIKLFNRIRMKTIAQNKLGRYIKYAIGEILLVVIGILIALQINTWNQNRVERTQESQILKSLKKEYIDNLNQLNDKIFIREKIIHSSNQLLDILDNNQNLQNYSVDSIETYIGTTTIFPTFNATSGVTNDIINSGKLHLIKDNDLRISLSNWTSDIDQVTEMETVLLEYYFSTYQPFLVKNIQLRNSFNAMLSLTHLTEKFNLNKSIQNVESVNRSNKILEYKTIFNNEDFEDYLVTILTYSRIANIQCEGLKLKINNNLSRIDKALNISSE